MGIHSRKLPVPRRFYNPSDIFSELGLSRGCNLNTGSLFGSSYCQAVIMISCELDVDTVANKTDCHIPNT